jgi:TfoX/Sxy family transcriptional regulator of competence genes
MSTDPDFVAHVKDQLGAAGAIAFRRMFGEYALYFDTKVVGLLCDNQLFVKPTEAGRALLGHAAREGQPYPGAKPWLLIGEDLDDRALLVRLIRTTADALPLPPPKKPKASRPLPAPGAKVAAKATRKTATASPAATKKIAATKATAKKVTSKKVAAKKAAPRKPPPRST